ncbi:MAG: PAS domain S-box protein [Nitrospirae bacterium]|nr:PAS domain S-box protein [Nitrospirota bacterium]
MLKLPNNKTISPIELFSDLFEVTSDFLTTHQCEWNKLIWNDFLSRFQNKGFALSTEVQVYINNLVESMNRLYDSSDPRSNFKEIMTDISQQTTRYINKWAEQTLQQSEKHFSSVVETASDAIITVDGCGIIVFGNQSVSKVFGFTQEEILGKPVTIIIPERFRAIHETAFKRFIETGKAKIIGRTLELLALRKDGSEFPSELSLSTWKSNESIFFTAIIRDITKRKKAEETIAIDYHIQKSLSSVLKISLEPISLEKQLEQILNHILPIPWLALEQKGCIFIVEEKSNVLVMKAHYGLPENIRKSCSSVPFGKCHCGKVAVTGKTLFATESDKYHTEITANHKPHGHLCIPILSAGKLLGVMNMYVKEGRRRDEIQEEFLSAIADTLAGIIERKKVEDAIRTAKDELETRVKERTERLDTSLKEKELLLSEIHHRVKNNLQIVSSLLKLQSRNINNTKYREIFRNSENQIQTMALIHEELYRSVDLTNINFGDYLGKLTKELFSSYVVDVSRIALLVNIENVILGIDTAIPCGLIINELISNALKYGFPGDKKGAVCVTLKTDPNTEECELRVSDNGIGIKGDVDLSNTQSLGLYLVTNLIDNQLHGSIELKRENGTEFIMRFKKRLSSIH